MLDMDRLPTHVAIVMDGNGRWAKKRALPRLAGHNAGMKAMHNIVKYASDSGIRYLTVYAFSTENWKRSVEEVSGIFGLLVRYVDAELAELNENNVRVNILGDYGRLPDDARERLDRTLRTTARNTGMTFNIALNYGSRDEITRAVKKLAQRVKDGELEPEDIDEAAVSAELWTGIYGVPDPELVIRTSGELRLSNYLLWQSAYSEFVFTDVLWPDFTPAEFDKALEEYAKRERRFGGR